MKKINRIIPITMGTAFILITACKDLPVASFTVSPDTAEVGDTIYFQNTSGGADTFDWDFGDGSVSTEENPSHIYTAEGTFTIYLAVTNADGSDEASGAVWIKPPVSNVIDVLVHSPGLEGNMLGDSPDRTVSIYLPPGYKNSINKNYPVIYFLHCFTCDNRTFFGGPPYDNVDFQTILDDLINTNEVIPMIVVVPNSYNKYGGSYYTNSFVTGKWEDFIIQDVVQYVDNNYRTIASRESRGIAGHSMGGYGTIKLAMRNPGLFSAAYMLNAGILVFEDDILGRFRSYLLVAVNAENLDGLTWQVLASISLAAAFAPDSNVLPFYGQFPVTETGELIDSIWQKWLQHDPYTMLPAYKDSLMKLNAIQFDCGMQDNLYYSNVKFSEALDDNGIEHLFEGYTGKHFDKLAERIELKLLPFFSAIFETDKK